MKKIVSSLFLGLFGSVGRVVIVLIVLFVFYQFPAISLGHGVDEDTLGWGFLWILCLLLFFAITISIYSGFVLHGNSFKFILTEIFSYLVVCSIFMYVFLSSDTTSPSLVYPILFLLINLTQLEFINFKKK